MWLRRTTSLLALALAACLPSVGPSLRPIDPVEPSPLQWERVMPRLVADADGVTVATITKIEDDWTYDAHCGIISQVMHRCGDLSTTEKLTLNTGQQLWTWTYGDFGLHKGERALFVWHYVLAARIFECQEHGAMTSQGCMSDRLPSLTEDLDVLPVADSARVAELRRTP